MFQFNTPTDRMMARVAMTILTLGLLFGLYEIGPPLYWRFYATVVHPFEGGPVQGGAPPAADNAFDILLDTDAAATDAQPPRTDAGASARPPPPKIQGFEPDDHALTKELIKATSQDGYIMVTWANEHYLDFAISWVANLKRAGITGYLVGAMDDDMLKSLVDRGIHTWRMNSGITKHDLGWGSANFHKMGRHKIQLIKDVLSLSEVTVVISDIDTAWLRPPFAFFDRFKAADLLTSTDQLGPTVKTEDLERFPQAGSAFNIGIMVFRPASRPFVDEWVKVLEKPDYWDQAAFNDLARQDHGNSDELGLWKGYKGRITVGVLPAALFASGHVFFVQRKHEELGLSPFVAHATFQYSGTPGKRHRFREARLFEDPPSYYDHPAGFIQIRVDIPAALWKAASQPVHGPLVEAGLGAHFALVHHQLLYVRAGMALATLTGRALVLPPIWCQLDKYWAPLWDGNIPGSSFRKPFICPMDHVLDIEGGWAPKKDENEFGPHLEWREYSFFDNPRLPAAVNASRLVVEVCAPGEAGCADGVADVQPKDGRLRLAPGLASDRLAAALKGAGQVKVLDVTNATALWPEFHEARGWFKDEAVHARFVRRLKHATSVMCCLKDTPGWVWYDALWDVPHTDRHGRKFDTWVVMPGDQARNPPAQQPQPATRRAARRLTGVMPGCEDLGPGLEASLAQTQAVMQGVGEHGGPLGGI